MTPRWIIITLLVSAALNFFLIGVGATVVVVGGYAARHRPLAQQTPAAAVRRAALALPAGPAREGFAATIRQAAGAEAGGLLQVRQARTEAWAAMGGASVDAAAIKAQLDAARAGEMAARQRIDAAVVDYLAKLPRAQRQAAAEELAPHAALRRAPPR